MADTAKQKEYIEINKKLDKLGSTASESEFNALLCAVDEVLVNALLKVDNGCHFSDHKGRASGLPEDIKALFQAREFTL